MAIWQFDLSLVHLSAPVPKLEGDFYKVTPLSRALTVEADEFLRACLGEPTEMLSGWFVFGTEDGNRIDVLKEDSSGSEISIRIDARSVDLSFIATACSLSVKLECVLFSPELASVIDPISSSIMAAVERSRAANFVADPRRFLDGPTKCG